MTDRLVWLLLSLSSEQTLGVVYVSCFHTSACVDKFKRSEVLCWLTCK